MVRTILRSLRLGSLLALIVAVGIIVPSAARSADPAQGGGCATKLSPETIAAFQHRWANPAPPSPFAPINPPYCVTIARHIVRRSDGTGGISLSQLDQGLADVNNAYAPMDIQFAYLPAIDYIDSDDYYFNIDTQGELDALRGINIVANAINVYFTSTASVDGFGLCGISSFSPDAVQGIVMINGCTGTPSNPSSYPHEIGHYFDLFHTHETAFGVEFVDGTNCTTAGDLLCDTPADPGLTDVVDDNCVYFGDAVDPNGDPYDPDTHQYMSYSVKICRDIFSPESQTKIVTTLVDVRPDHLVLGCAPVADAGDDTTAECTSPTTTAVQLDGTGSSDLDGDPLTFEWSASGVSFDDATSPTPTGQFSFGTTTVSLKVSDGTFEDFDTVLVTIDDTTRPEIVCPADTTVECTSHLGTPKDDPQLAAFFAGVSATDVCDSSLPISNDAPDYFPLGVTVVTFTTADDHGNADTCQATVTVVDTTPPEIAVELNRYSLWPPNHKMSPITVDSLFVSDICDSNPTVVLDTIYSDEPDNGLGDGDTANDIQEAAFGTLDLAFLLRSERAGVGDGRVYTIVFRATDHSGNSTDDTVAVTVPHSQAGLALAGVGYNQARTDFVPRARTFTIVVPSTPEFDAQQVAAEYAQIGNHIGVVDPLSFRTADLDGDGLADLELTFPVPATRALRQLSGPLDPIGLHYTIVAGNDYLVPDIFALASEIQEAIVLKTDGSEGTVAAPVLHLYRPTPNPFSAESRLAYAVNAPAGEFVDVAVYNVAGQKVRTLVSGHEGQGVHEVTWDGRSESGLEAPSGVYFYRTVIGAEAKVVRVTIAR
jgi:hypothetical protein